VSGYGAVLFGAPVGCNKKRLSRRAVQHVKERNVLLARKLRLAFQQPNAAIPAQDGVVVPGRAKLLRFREAPKRFF